MIATNTIAQGDTRSTGLRWICTNGGDIYRARRRVKWPGLAAVVVSVLHVHKGDFRGVKLLDGGAVDTITAFLFHRGGHDDPARLKANAGKSFVGSYILGMGFTFDDTDTKGVATPLTEMHQIIAEEPRSQDAIFPYIGGEEENTSPTQAHHRYVINFRDYPLRREVLGELWEEANYDRRREWLRSGIVPLDFPAPAAADWPVLLAIVKERVKGARGNHSTAPWWVFERLRPELFVAIAGMDRVLANSQVSANLQFAFLPPRMVYAHTLNIYPFQTHAAFCVVQSRPHEIWARFLGSSMKDDLRYTPSDCFETFPFPDGWNTHPDLERAGTDYYHYRADLMIRHDEGLTKTYNRFHDRDETDPDIARLRDLHAAMDRAALDAYGWTDISTDCEFLLDYEIDEEDWGTRKKPYRYRWPDDVRDEVLARLLELNAQRSEAEQRAGDGAHTTNPRTGTRRPRVRAARTAPETGPAPGTLWNDNPLDGTHSGGTPDGTET